MENGQNLQKVKIMMKTMKVVIINLLPITMVRDLVKENQKLKMIKKIKKNQEKMLMEKMKKMKNLIKQLNGLKKLSMLKKAKVKKKYQ